MSVSNPRGQFYLISNSTTLFKQLIMAT